MIMWLRLTGALLATLAALGALEYFGVSRLLGGRSADDASAAAQERARELFWMMIFVVVMATALLAASRRWAGHLRRFAVRQTARRSQA